MDKIRTIYERDVFPNKPEPKNIVYSDRNTVKAIVLDSDNKIALVGNVQNNYLQLPGGGVDEGEDIRLGVVRECLEEIGCTIKIIEDIGIIDDYRPRDKKHCINYCFAAKVIGNKQSPKHTAEELRIGMFTRWVSPNEALAIFRNQQKELEEGKVTFYNTGYNILRDLLFLDKAFSLATIHE
jgi:ADP-ribose pyrophosphatase YjhB (NUDIX family)